MPPVPKVRELVTWIMSHPEGLATQDQVRLKDALRQCPHLEAAAERVSSFAEMLTGLYADRLGGWIAQVEAEPLAGLGGFACGFKRDNDAVRNAMSLPHSSGAVEGNVNRIKMLKRQMYGRANLDLLRIRILLTR